MSRAQSFWLDRISNAVVATVAGGLVTAPAWAHEVDVASDQMLLSTWTLSADIIVPTVLAAVVYARGMARARSGRTEWHRHLLFFAGLGALFLALQSPIDPIAERLFWVHQIQHLLLRMLAPMLLVLAWPQAVLTSGLPAGIRKAILAPVLSNSQLQRVFAGLSQPVPATLVFIGTLYVWQVPALHNVALENEPIHYLMHVTMLLAGMLFWWRIFDQRPAGKGSRYGVRLMMLWLAVLSNIVLGAYTSFKGTVLYTAYDEPPGRLFDMSSLADEKLGGIIIWIPSSMMVLLAVIIVIRMLGRHEARLDTQRLEAEGTGAVASRPAPTTASGLIEQARVRNRAIALGFAMFVTTIFASAILVGVLDQFAHRSSHLQLAGAGHHDAVSVHAAPHT